jgi:hypothetical protein
MNKLEIQRYVKQHKKLIDLEKFEWDENTKTFSTNENDLVLFLPEISGVNFKTGNNCEFTTAHSCNFETGHNCSFKTKDYNSFSTGSGCIFVCGQDNFFKTGSNCTFNATSNNCFTTGSFCKFTACKENFFKTSSNCNFNVGEECYIRTADNSSIFALSDNIIYAGNNCNFIVKHNCSIVAGNRCVIVNSNVFDIIYPEPNKLITINSIKEKGHTVDGMPFFKSFYLPSFLSSNFNKITKVFQERLFRMQKNKLDEIENKY